VILPDWPERFRDLDFRALVERVLREEAPAHVQVKVCWIGQRQMTELDDRYHQWLLALRNGSAQAIRQPARRLIDLMTQLVTVYPAATLHDCDDGDDDTPVRLGASALGIF
jgi:hypothetical protein